MLPVSVVYFQGKVRQWAVNTQLALMLMSDFEEKIISLRIFMPELLRNEFKAACARQGRNMSEVVTDFARNYVAKYGAILPSSDSTESDQATAPEVPSKTKTKAQTNGNGKGRGKSKQSQATKSESYE